MSGGLERTSLKQVYLFPPSSGGTNATRNLGRVQDRSPPSLGKSQPKGSIGELSNAHKEVPEAKANKSAWDFVKSGLSYFGRGVAGLVGPALTGIGLVAGFVLSAGVIFLAAPSIAGAVVGMNLAGKDVDLLETIAQCGSAVAWLTTPVVKAGDALLSIAIEGNTKNIDSALEEGAKRRDLAGNIGGIFGAFAFLVVAWCACNAR